MRHYLGVDGGGSKTAFLLAAEDGTVLAEAEGPGSYYLDNTAGTDLVERVFADGIAAVCHAAATAPADLARAFFGIPSYGEVTADLPALDALPARILGHDRYSCGNDMVCGWAGSLGGADGINVIAGTGSMTYGERRGVGARAGGWGELFSDEGSGHWVGLEGLRAFTRMSDGRLARGPLYGRIRETIGVEHDLDVIDVVLGRWHRDRGRVAELSRAVAAAAEDGDPVARAILGQAAVELVALVEATRTCLGFEDGEPVPVSYSGGMFAIPSLRERFSTHLAASANGYDLRTPLAGPAAGAALYAAREDGNPFDADAVARLGRPKPTTTPA